MSTKTPTSGFNGTETVVSSTQAPARARTSWGGWGLVGASLLAAGAAVVIVETDTHWTDIMRWFHS